jgi:hypothetical protein
MKRDGGPVRKEVREGAEPTRTPILNKKEEELEPQTSSGASAPGASSRIQ